MGTCGFSLCQPDPVSAPGGGPRLDSRRRGDDGGVSQRFPSVGLRDPKWPSARSRRRLSTERAIDLMMDEVRRGRITPAEAECDYWVCVTQETGRVDEARTDSLRSKRGRSDYAADTAAEGATEARHRHAREMRHE